MKASGFFSGGKSKHSFVRASPDKGADLQMSSLGDVSNASEPSYSAGSANTRSAENGSASISADESVGSVSTDNSNQKKKYQGGGRRIQRLDSLDRISSHPPLRPLVDDSSCEYGWPGSEKKVVVFILSKDPNSDSTKKAVKIFNDDYFHVIIIHNENQEWMKNYPHHAEKRYYSFCLNQAREKYPNHYIIIARDSSVSNVHSAQIAQTVNSAISANSVSSATSTTSTTSSASSGSYLQNATSSQNASSSQSPWHLCYLSRWNDNCEVLTPLEEGGSGQLVKTIEPHGLQALVISPEGRKILEGSKSMRDGSNFPCEIATSEEEARRIDAILAQRAKAGKAVGETKAQTAAAQASGIAAAQNAGAQVKAVDAVSGSGSGSYLVQSFTFEDCIREQIAKGNLNAIATTFPLVYYDHRRARNHHRMNVCRGTAGGSGSYVDANGSASSAANALGLNGSTSSFLLFFIGFIILIVIIALIAWAVSQNKKKKAVLLAVGPATAPALPVVATRSI